MAVRSSRRVVMREKKVSGIVVVDMMRVVVGWIETTGWIHGAF